MAGADDARRAKESVGERMIDPTCVFHGKKRSEHLCLTCCLCYIDLTLEECWEDEEGYKHDVCIPCRKREEEYAKALRRTG